MARIIVLTAAIIIFTCAPIFAFDDGDWQYWNTESASAKIADKWKAAIEEELRWGDDMRNPYYNHTEFGIAYSGLADWFGLSINYRHINEEKSGGWKTECQPNINGTIKWKIQDFSFSNKSRFEFKEREDADEVWQYRNKLSLTPSLSLTEYNIQPYVADETFFDSDSQELNRKQVLFRHLLQYYQNAQGRIVLSLAALQILIYRQVDRRERRRHETKDLILTRLRGIPRL